MNYSQALAANAVTSRVAVRYPWYHDETRQVSKSRIWVVNTSVALVKIVSARHDFLDSALSFLDS